MLPFIFLFILYRDEKFHRKELYKDSAFFQQLFSSLAFSSSSMVQNLPAKVGDSSWVSWVANNPWGRKWQFTPVFLPRKSHGQRGLVGYNPWGCKRVRCNWTTNSHYYPSTFIRGVLSYSKGSSHIWDMKADLAIMAIVHGHSLSWEAYYLSCLNPMPSIYLLTLFPLFTHTQYLPPFHVMQWFTTG